MLGPDSQLTKNDYNQRHTQIQMSSNVPHWMMQLLKLIFGYILVNSLQTTCSYIHFWIYDTLSCWSVSCLGHESNLVSSQNLLFFPFLKIMLCYLDLVAIKVLSWSL